jgi:hypothetical protein
VWLRAQRGCRGCVCVCAIYLKFKVDDATCYHNPLLLIVLVGCWKYIPGRRLLQCLSPFPIVVPICQCSHCWIIWSFFFLLLFSPHHPMCVLSTLERGGGKLFSLSAAAILSNWCKQLQTDERVKWWRPERKGGLRPN